MDYEKLISNAICCIGVLVLFSLAIMTVILCGALFAQVFLGVTLLPMR